MILKSITLKNFRNYRSETLTFHERFNVIAGDNAQGKTNLLEAINLLCTFRPFKQVKMEELILFGEEEGRVKGEIELESGLNEVHIVLRKGGKTLKLNGKVIYNTTKFTGKFNIITFLPSDLEIIKGAIQDRRKYIDTVICNIIPEHLRDLKLYFRALTQRNALLTHQTQVSKESIEVWNETIAEIGGRITRRRIKFIKKIEPEIKEAYRQISGLETDIQIQYKTSFTPSVSFEEDIKRELELRFSHDRKYGHTSVGPHRDQIDFAIDGKIASVFASQGEAKTLVLALKTSEIKLLTQILKRTPILILDDITSELDYRRRSFLFHLLREFNGQIFITTTAPKEILYKGEKKVFFIEGGKVQPTVLRYSPVY
ncbi:MAG: DNA replication and repair protein RecF [Deltaproteobacteria bacterium]|nr:MAG: DNA replication and repair protein RecF [Deltaproteobacteria bacterium]